MWHNNLSQLRETEKLLAVSLQRVLKRREDVYQRIDVAESVTHIVHWVPLAVSKPSATTFWVRPVPTQEGTADRVTAEVYRTTDGAWTVQVRRRLSDRTVTQDAILPAAFPSAGSALKAAMRWVATGDLPKGCEHLTWR